MTPGDGALSTFHDLRAEVMSDGVTFGHRQHIHVTWLAVRERGMPDAIEFVSTGLRRAVSLAGTPDKFHATMTRAWVELVGHYAPEHPTADFDTFTAAHPELLDQELLTQYYRPETLASSRARTSWVEPDLAPFPWSE